MNNRIITILLSISSLTAQNYNWPLQQFDQQHWINGTFCENRPDVPVLIDHFHNGVDIDLDQGNNVYSVISGTVTSLSRVGINAYVRVGRYAYVHVDPGPAIDIGSQVTAFQTVIGTTNSYNHIHFVDGYVGNEINPLRQGGGLDPFVDSYDPEVEQIFYYINGTTTMFNQNRVSGLVEIVAKASDITDNGPVGGNNGIYFIGYQIFDSSGAMALTDEIENLRFDQRPSNSYVTNVFFPPSDLSNYYYTVTNGPATDGYWDTGAFAPGTYQIRVFTGDTRNNIAERWSTVQVASPDYTPPAIPVFSLVEGDASAQWTMHWLPNDSSDVSGYDFYFSYDGVDWNYQSTVSGDIASGDTNFVFSNFANGVTVYFQLAARDDSAPPNTSETSDAYGVRISASGPEVLIVDGFDRTSGYWQQPVHDFNVIYGEIMTHLDIPFDNCSDEAIARGRIQLRDYPVVIYYLGDEGEDQKALSTEEQAALQDYLQNGGKLVLAGSGLVSSLLYHGSDADSNFVRDFLKVGLVADSAASLHLNGVSGTMFSDFSADIIVPGDNSISNDILNTTDADSIITYDQQGLAATLYRGVFPDGSAEASLALLAFPLELIDSAQDRIELLALILDRFGLQTDLNFDDESWLPDRHELLANYPNPFNPSTQITYLLSASSHVHLDIFSLTGRKITTLVNRPKSAGRHETRWDGTDHNGNSVSSGIYIYRLQAGNFIVSRKMVLLR